MAARRPRLIESAAESERLAARGRLDRTASSSCPALTGLGSPHWDAEARGLICGLTRGTTRAHLVRAALEAIAHQVADILDVLPVEADVLRADGGATANRFLMQFQADLIGSPVEVAADADATALGAAALAGLAVGVWPNVEALGALMRRGARYEPSHERRREGAAARGLAARVAPRDGRRVTWVIAHRGASADEKENTLPAFERAIELGADYVEFDVQASSDGGLVVFHDLRLDRLTPARGPLRGAPARRAARARDPDPRGGARADRRADRRHGRAEEPVALPPPRHRRPHGAAPRAGRRRRLVLAPRDPRDAAAAARAAHRAARRLRDVDPRRRAASPGRRASTTPASRRAGSRKAHALGLKALVYTVNEPSRLLALQAIGVDGVFSDRPDLARATLARRPG